MQPHITTSVMRLNPPRFDMTGQKLRDTLAVMDDAIISPGLVKRLHQYALKRAIEAGFDVSGWPCEIYTMNGDERASDRYYTIEFTNSKGGKIGVQGVGTNHGHPVSDHGLCIESPSYRFTRG